MSAPLKRINIHLDTAVIAVYDEFARTMGASRAAVVRQLLQESAPGVQKLTEVLKDQILNPDPEHLRRSEIIAERLAAGLDKGLDMMRAAE